MGPPDFSLAGFAAMNGGTTGGAGGDIVVVDSGRELRKALDDKDFDRPLTILVNGTISTRNTGRENWIHIDFTKNLSILGVGHNSRLDGVGIRISRASNIMIRNLTIHEVDSGRDRNALVIEGPSNNIWIDHNKMHGSLSFDHDELIQTGNGVEFVTISYNHFLDNREAIRHGGGSGEANHYVTIHHNHFQNVDSETPRFLSGFGHIYNNYYDNITGSGINSRRGAHLRIENNHFQNSRNPILSSGSGAAGYWDSRHNIFENTTWVQENPSDVIASIDPDDCSAQTTIYNPPYAYTLDPVERTRSLALNFTGVGVINIAMPRGAPERKPREDD